MGKWVVCAAWPYVHMVPHLGTFIHLLSADVFTRYLRLKGEDVISVTGSDEHGTPIEVEAIKAGVSPKDLTDKQHAIICGLLDKFAIHFDNYTRTENPVHIKFVQEFYRKIYENDFIFSQTVELPFCPKCERFLPDRFVEGECPHCGSSLARGDQCDACGRVLDPVDLRSPRCVFCGTTPDIRASKHWFFDLPKFGERLKAYINSNPQLPDNARNFSYRWIEEGLRPRALTRDNKWGIPAPFPGAEQKTIYVWMEAVLGYVSASVEWAEKNGRPESWKRYWFDKDTKNVHFIGKDNIPFHTIIFPALLMATREDYLLPWQVSSTEFIMFEGQRFSRSRRIGVWMDETIELAEADYWRFVLMAIRPELKDANFTWSEFEARINSELNDAIGNFIHRTLSFLHTYFENAVPSAGLLDDLDKGLLKEIENSPGHIGDLFEQFKLRDALSAIVDLARKGNQYLSTKEPWHLIKTDREKTATALFISAQLVYALAILLEPFMPSTAEKIWNLLNIPGSVHSQKWEDAGKLQLHVGHKIGEPKPIFHKVDAKEIEKKRKAQSLQAK